MVIRLFIEPCVEEKCVATIIRVLDQGWALGVVISLADGIDQIDGRANSGDAVTFELLEVDAGLMLGVK